MKSWSVILIVFILIFVSLIITLFVQGYSNGIETVNKPKVAVVSISGPLLIDGNSGSFLNAKSSTNQILQSLNKIKDDKSIKGLILEINSPGGMVVASKEVADKIKELEIPKVALIREVGASGAYWIASAADTIIASPMSITGSIGVISSYLEFSELFDKYGVNYQRLVAGERKDIATPFKTLTEDEKKILEKKLSLIHQAFVSEVAMNRKMKEEEVWKSATGEFFLGVEAKERGLVDVLGDAGTAKDIMKEKLGVKDIELVKFKHEKSLFDLFGMVSSDLGYQVGRGIGDSLVESQQGSIKI